MTPAQDVPGSVRREAQRTKATLDASLSAPWWRRWLWRHGIGKGNQ